MKEKRQYRIYMCIAIIALIIGICAAIGVKVNAAEPVEAIKSVVDAFQTLEGEQAYVQLIYFDKYYLDMEKTSPMEMGYAMINNMANTLFTTIKWLAKLTVTLFYFCMDFDLTALFGDQIKEIQQALNSGIFQPLFLLGFAGTALVLLKKYIRRDLAGALGQIARVVFLVVLSILVVKESGTILSNTTQLTKAISAQAISGINGGNQDMSSYAASCSGVLWVQLIHQPWLTIEFGSDRFSDEDVLLLMNNSPDEEERKNYVNDYQGTAFSMRRASERLGFLCLYMFPFVIKCAIYIAVSLIQLIFQLIALFYVIMAPVILIVSMFPGYEGILGVWVRKILESQIGILIITFFSGLMLKLDSLLFAMSQDWRWLLVMAIQVVIAGGAVLKRNEIFGALNKLHHAAASPGYAKSILHKGIDGYAVAAKGGTFIDKGARMAGGYLKYKAGDVAQEVMDEVGRGMSNVGKTISKGRQASRQASIMQAAESYHIEFQDEQNATKNSDIKVTERQAERPVPEQQKNISGADTKQVAEEPLEPQIKVERPRLDNFNNFNQGEEKSNVVAFKEHTRTGEPQPAENITERKATVQERQIDKSSLQPKTRDSIAMSSQEPQQRASEPQIKAEHSRAEKITNITENAQNEAYKAPHKEPEEMRISDVTVKHRDLAREKAQVKRTTIARKVPEEPGEINVTTTATDSAKAAIQRPKYSVPQAASRSFMQR